jgi:hypothetical protein
LYIFRQYEAKIMFSSLSSLFLKYIFCFLISYILFLIISLSSFGG